MHANSEQEDKELNDYLRRAELSPDKSGPVRREAYDRLLKLAHSSNTAHKVLATKKIKGFFSDFPELQDEAINTIYDLCEDQDSEVRIAGYEAITSVSKVDKNWLVRNADVLVQLLQSDEPDEVAVVQNALQEHIEMDAPRTLQVLCDQCIFEASGLDEEERLLRGRLRTLVIRFLAETAKGRIAQVVRVKEGNVEQVLFGGLINAIPKSTHDEISMIVDILLSLPSLATRGANGHGLLAALLTSASNAIKDDLRSASELSSLSNARVYLRLASVVGVRKHAADPLELLRFYLASNLISKMTLQRLTEETQIMIVSELADAWDACDSLLQPGKTTGREQVTFARNQLVEACPNLFDVLTKSGLSETPSCRACLTLLKACQSRKNDSKWVVPTHLANGLSEMQIVASSRKNGPNADLIQSVQSLCRSLLELYNKPAISRSASDTNKPIGSIGNSNNLPSPPSGKRRFDQRQPSLSWRPGPTNSPFNGGSSAKDGSAPSRSAGSRDWQGSPHPRPSTSMPAILNAAIDKELMSDTSLPLRKRLKQTSVDDSGGSSSGAPSLLSRMESRSNGSTMRVSNGPPLRSRPDLQHRSVNAMHNLHFQGSLDDNEPLRIKGAAHLDATNAPPTSLLERMGNPDRMHGDDGRNDRSSKSHWDRSWQ